MDGQGRRIGWKEPSPSQQSWANPRQMDRLSRKKHCLCGQPLAGKSQEQCGTEGMDSDVQQLERVNQLLVNPIEVLLQRDLGGISMAESILLVFWHLCIQKHWTERLVTGQQSLSQSVPGISLALCGRWMNRRRGLHLTFLSLRYQSQIPSPAIQSHSLWILLPSEYDVSPEAKATSSLKPLYHLSFLSVPWPLGLPYGAYCYVLCIFQFMGCLSFPR